MTTRVEHKESKTTSFDFSISQETQNADQLRIQQLETLLNEKIDCLEDVKDELDALKQEKLALQRTTQSKDCQLAEADKLFK